MMVKILARGENYGRGKSYFTGSITVLTHNKKYFCPYCPGKSSGRFRSAGGQAIAREKRA